MTEKIELSHAVHAEHHGDVLVISADNPPLNLLSAPVRQGIARGLKLGQETGGITVIILTATGETGFCGADIREFGQPMAPPDLPTLIKMVADSPRPVVAALNGRTLGGGLELALACRARVAVNDARMGLPEIRLGLIPGAGGIPQVTRLAGVAAALDLCISGREVGAEEALKVGLVDAVADASDLIMAAKDLATALPDRRQVGAGDTDTLIAEWQKGPGRRMAGQDAPREAIALIRASAADPGASLQAETLAAFHRLESGSQSAALRHLFAAERRVRDLPFLSEGTESRQIRRVGIIGAGTMGSGIAAAMLAAGLEVVLHDASTEGLTRGQAQIGNNLQGAVKRNKMTGAAREAALGRLTTAENLSHLSDADLLIEAVYESLPLKLEIFTHLDRIAKPGAILASNTSFLDIDQMAAATSRPQDVLGMHFFSPAHVMRLLEVVRGSETAPEVVASAMELGRRIGKIAVCVGNCHGFVGNRILLRRQDAAMELLLEGHSPYAIDKAMTDFGLPMGPFAMADLAGLDVGWDREHSAGRTMEEVFCEAGRLGRKSGGGYYDYDAKGRTRPSDAARALIRSFRARRGSSTAPESDSAELLQRLLGPMLEECCKIVEEGIVLRPSDIDVIWVHGYGWPAWRGGPEWYRQQQAQQ